MAKNQVPSASNTPHKLLTHGTHNPSGAVVTGKDPKGVVVTICVEEGAKKQTKNIAPPEWVVVKKGDAKSLPFPGFNARTKELFDLWCKYEGVPVQVAKFANNTVSVVQAAGKIHVSYKDKTETFAIDTTTNAAGISKEARVAINKFIETELPGVKPGKVELKAKAA